MNYSRTGGPTPVNKPGVDKRVDDKMEVLLDEQKALEEAVDYYKAKIKDDDFWKEWYQNHLDSYQRKLDKVRREICNTSGVVYESTKGTETEKIVARIGASPTPTKEESPKRKEP